VLRGHRSIAPARASESKIISEHFDLDPRLREGKASVEIEQCDRVRARVRDSRNDRELLRLGRCAQGDPLRGLIRLYALRIRDSYADLASLRKYRFPSRIDMDFNPERKRRLSRRDDKPNIGRTCDAATASGEHA
jgi:hypothetical protein